MIITGSLTHNSANITSKQCSVAKPLPRYSKSLRLPVVCALLFGAIFSFPHISANAQNGTQDRIRVKSASSKCWQKKTDDMNNGNIIHIWDCEDGPIFNKAFFYEPSTGFIRSSFMPSKCIHKKTGGWNVGDIVHLWDCDLGEAQNKTFDYDVRSGQIRFRHNPSFCAQTSVEEFARGNSIVVGLCSSAESYTHGSSSPVRKPGQ